MVRREEGFLENENLIQQMNSFYDIAGAQREHIFFRTPNLQPSQ